MISNKLLILFYLMLFLFINPIFAETEFKIYIGFIDNGFWYKAGAMFIEIPDIINTDELIEKYKISNKNYIDLNMDSNIDIQKQSVLKTIRYFKIYSKNGYLGDYKIDSFSIIGNACTDDYYIYAKLDGIPKIQSEDQTEDIIAVPVFEQNSYNIDEIRFINEIMLSSLKKKSVEKILSDKLKNAKKDNVFKELIKQIEKKNLKFILKYKTFPITINNQSEYSILISAIWNIRWPNMELGDGYYLTNNFIIDKNRIFELQKMYFSSVESLDRNEILFGIEIDKKIFWLIKNVQFEGSQMRIVQYNINNQTEIILIRGNYFGC